jgi:hypothetical protein
MGQLIWLDCGRIAENWICKVNTSHLLNEAHHWFFDPIVGCYRSASYCLVMIEACSNQVLRCGQRPSPCQAMQHGTRVCEWRFFRVRRDRRQTIWNTMPARV